jgi:hypothetical protein
MVVHRLVAFGHIAVDCGNIDLSSDRIFVVHLERQRIIPTGQIQDSRSPIPRLFRVEYMASGNQDEDSKERLSTITTLNPSRTPNDRERYAASWLRGPLFSWNSVCPCVCVSGRAEVMSVFNFCTGLGVCVAISTNWREARLGTSLPESRKALKMWLESFFLN